jgi:hypothetical protein
VRKAEGDHWDQLPENFDTKAAALAAVRKLIRERRAARHGKDIREASGAQRNS